MYLCLLFGSPSTEKNRVLKSKEWRKKGEGKKKSTGLKTATTQAQNYFKNRNLRDIQKKTSES